MTSTTSFCATSSTPDRLHHGGHHHGAPGLTGYGLACRGRNAVLMMIMGTMIPLRGDHGSIYMVVMMSHPEHLQGPHSPFLVSAFGIFQMRQHLTTFLTEPSMPPVSTGWGFRHLREDRAAQLQAGHRDPRSPPSCQWDNLPWRFRQPEREMKTIPQYISAFAEERSTDEGDDGGRRSPACRCSSLLSLTSTSSASSVYESRKG